MQLRSIEKRRERRWSVGRLMAATGAICLGMTVGLRADASDTPSTVVPLEVTGRASATPHLATLGETVVVVWSARREGASDIYLARSDDGGRTFAPPVRVNDRADDADVGGEMPP